VATPLQRKAEHRGAPKLPETSRDALALQWGRPVDRGLRDTKVEETLCNLRARDRTKCSTYRRVSREPTTLDVVWFERQIMSEPVGERDHFANDVNGNASVGVGDIGGDIIDIGPGDYTGVDVLHSGGIHVYHDS
jgi:hypothetical protein